MFEKNLFLFRFPWNQETAIGYLYEICYDLIIVEIYWVCNGSLLVLFVSICLHFQAFYEMFEQMTNNQFNSTEDFQNYQQSIQKLHLFQKSIKA